MYYKALNITSWIMGIYFISYILAIDVLCVQQTDNLPDLVIRQCIRQLKEGDFTVDTMNISRAIKEPFLKETQRTLTFQLAAHKQLYGGLLSYKKSCDIKFKFNLIANTMDMIERRNELLNSIDSIIDSHCSVTTWCLLLNLSLYLKETGLFPTNSTRVSYNYMVSELCLSKKPTFLGAVSLLSLGTLTYYYMRILFEIYIDAL